MRKSIIIVWIYFGLIVLGVIGEIKCVIKAFQCNWEPIGKAEILYTAAACTGLGAIVGYIDIQDK